MKVRHLLSGFAGPVRRGSAHLLLAANQGTKGGALFRELGKVRKVDTPGFLSCHTLERSGPPVSRHMGRIVTAAVVVAVISALVTYTFREAIEDGYNLRAKNYPLDPAPPCTRHTYEGMLHAEDLTIWREGLLLMSSGDLQKAFKTGAETVRVPLR